MPPRSRDGPEGDDAAAGLVAAIGRGDAADRPDALEADNVFASESHHGVFAALGLPTARGGLGPPLPRARTATCSTAVPLVTA